MYIVMYVDADRLGPLQSFDISAPTTGTNQSEILNVELVLPKLLLVSEDLL